MENEKNRTVRENSEESGERVKNDPDARSAKGGDAPEEYESNAARRLRMLGEGEAGAEGAQGGDGEEEIVETTASRLSNFWYHNKWKVIIGGAFAFILLIAVSQYFSHSSPDASLLYSGTTYITANGNRAFCAVLEDMMDDYNGDGRTYAQLNDLVFYTDDQLAEYEAYCKENNIDAVVDRMANAQAAERFTYQVFGGESLICILSPDQYRMVAQSGGFVKLAEIFDEIPEGAVDEYGVRFAETKLWKFYDAVRIFPDDVIVALRTLPTVSAMTGRKRAEREHAYNEALFKKILTFEYPKGYVPQE